MTNNDKIDLYLTDRMSAPERASFEREMAADPALAEEVTMQRELIRAIQAKGAKEYLQQVEKNIQRREKRFRIFKIYAPAIAAAACLLVGIFFQTDLNRTCRALGYGLELEIESSRGGDALGRIVELIESENFEAALTLIHQEREALPSVYSDTEEGQYLKHQDDIYKADLDWYETVVYLRAGKYWKAKKWLKRIASEQGYYSSQASMILDKM